MYKPFPERLDHSTKPSSMRNFLFLLFLSRNLFHPFRVNFTVFPPLHFFYWCGHRGTPPLRSCDLISPFLVSLLPPPPEALSTLENFVNGVIASRYYEPSLPMFPSILSESNFLHFLFYPPIPSPRSQRKRFEQEVRHPPLVQNIRDRSRISLFPPFISCCFCLLSSSSSLLPLEVCPAKFPLRPYRGCAHARRQPRHPDLSPLSAPPGTYEGLDPYTPLMYIVKPPPPFAFSLLPFRCPPPSLVPHLFPSEFRRSRTSSHELHHHDYAGRCFQSNPLFFSSLTFSFFLARCYPCVVFLLLSRCDSPLIVSVRS